MYLLYMSQPVPAPSIIPRMMLIQLMALVPASIFSPLFAIAANLDPTKIGISSLGVTIAVAKANMRGSTVGKVEIAPFDIE